MLDQLDSWWRFRLTAAQRDRLIDIGDGPLPAQLAYDVWRSSGAIVPVDHVVDSGGEWSWRLTPEVARFVRSRATLSRAGNPGPRVA